MLIYNQGIDWVFHPYRNYTLFYITSVILGLNSEFEA